MSNGRGSLALAGLDQVQNHEASARLVLLRSISSVACTSVLSLLRAECTAELWGGPAVWRDASAVCYVAGLLDLLTQDLLGNVLSFLRP